jgi:hypothetical protein
MKIKTIKNVNITALFPEPVKHSLVDPEIIVSLFSDTTTNAGEIKKNVIEAPGLKVVILPELKKEFVFEPVRILVNDKSEKTLEHSSVIDDFKKLADKKLIDQSKIIAYGFNFDAIVIPDGAFSVCDLVGAKIAKIQNISNVGIMVDFKKNNLKYDFNLAPVGEENMFLAHLNVHFAGTIPEFDVLKKQLTEQFKEFEETIAKI